MKKLMLLFLLFLKLFFITNATTNDYFLASTLDPVIKIKEKVDTANEFIDDILSKQEFYDTLADHWKNSIYYSTALGYKSKTYLQGSSAAVSGTFQTELKALAKSIVQVGAHPIPSKKLNDKLLTEIIFNKNSSNIGTIFFYDNSIVSISSEAMSAWMVYAKVYLGNFHSAITDLKERSEADEKLATLVAETYCSFISTSPSANFSSFLQKNPIMPNIDFEINCHDKFVPQKIFDSTIIRDVSFLISGSEGKFNTSKIGVDLISPGLNLSLAIPNLKNPNNSIQFGLKLNLRDPISQISIGNPNFNGTINFQYDRIFKKISHFKFNYNTCVDCMLKSYGIAYDKKNSIDSFYLNAPWNTKKLFWFSAKLDGTFKSYNVYDPIKSDTVLRAIHGAFTGGFSFNFHHYVNKHYKGKPWACGNKYLKAGADFSYSNSIDNENLKGDVIQQIDSLSPGIEKITKQAVAYNKDDFYHHRFTFSPFLDFYLMDKSRHIGMHLLMKSNIEVDRKKVSDKSLLCGFGIFASINNDKIGKLAGSNVSAFNFEILLTTRNLLDKNVTTSKSFTSIFVPEIKFEIPFTLLER